MQAGKTLEEIVEAQGMTRADLAEALYAAAAGRIDTALAEGKITQLQAERLLDRLAERRDACADDGQCHLRPRQRPQRPPRRVQVRRMQAGQTIAQALEMTPQELAQAIRSGQTIEEVAAEQGLSMADLAETLYAAAESRIAEALAKGKITQAQADRMLQTLSQRRDACVVDGQCRLFPHRPGAQVGYLNSLLLKMATKKG